jgi:hypothetical protein
MTNRDLMIRRLYDYKTLTIISCVQNIYYKKTIIYKKDYIDDLLDYLDI